MSAPAVTQAYCEMRSGGIEKMQNSAERRMDGQNKKLDELTRACIQLTAAVDRVTRILEKQDARIERLENRDPLEVLETPTGKKLLRIAGVGLLILLCAGVGVNVIELLKEVL